MSTSRPPIDVAQIAQDPMGAPLLPVDTAVEVHDLVIEFTKSLNAFPNRAPAVVTYVNRLPAPVRTYMLACLRNLTGAVTPEVVTAVSESPAYQAIGDTQALAIRGALMLRARMSTERLERHVARGTIGLAELVDRFHRAQNGHGSAQAH